MGLFKKYVTLIELNGSVANSCPFVVTLLLATPPRHHYTRDVFEYDA